MHAWNNGFLSSGEAKSHNSGGRISVNFQAAHSWLWAWGFWFFLILHFPLNLQPRFAYCKDVDAAEFLSNLLCTWWLLVFVGLESFQAKPYLDPHLMNIGKRNLRKRRLQRRMMQAPRSCFATDWILITPKTANSWTSIRALHFWLNFRG